MKIERVQSLERICTRSLSGQSAAVRPAAGTRPDMTMTISETTRWSEQFTKVPLNLHIRALLS
jgi:hypothetical protein